MKQAFQKWNTAYQDLMVKTRFISQFAVLWVALMARFEMVWLAKSIYVNYSEIGPELMQHLTLDYILKIAVFICFGIRFLLLFRRSRVSGRIINATWLLAAAAGLLYYVDSKNYFISSSSIMDVYGMENLDPVITGYSMFIVFSGVRFILTAIIAIFRIK